MSKGPWKETAGRAIMGKLKADAVKFDEVVLTIKECFLQRIGKESHLAVEFVEFPGKAMQCNKTMAAAFQALVGHGHLPDNYNETTESFAWEGRQVPFKKRTVEFTDRETGEVTETLKLYPVSPAIFDKMLAEYPTLDGATKKGSRSKSKK